MIMATPPRRAGVARVELMVFIFTVIFVAAALLLWSRSQQAPPPAARPAAAPADDTMAQWAAELAQRSNEVVALNTQVQSLMHLHTSLLVRVDAGVDPKVYQGVCEELATTRGDLQAAQARIAQLLAAAQSTNAITAEYQQYLQQEIDRLRAALAIRATQSPTAPPQSQAEYQFVRTNAALWLCPQPRRAPKSWLEKSGLNGMGRGALRLVTAPVLVPYGVVRGITSPFRADPEMGGATNYALFAATQTALAPLNLALHSTVGAGTCCGDTLRGCADIVSFGTYGLLEEKFVSNPDYRPYLLQLLASDVTAAEPTNALVQLPVGMPAQASR
jgi:hypothetical protein